MYNNVFLLIIILIFINEIINFCKEEKFTENESAIDSEMESEPEEPQDMVEDPIQQHDELIEEEAVQETEQINFDKPEPWVSIILSNNFNEYHCHIPFFHELKYSAWQDILINNIDRENKTIKIRCTTEEEALAILNLIISNFLGDLELEEIIKSKLLSVSIKKATRFKPVAHKLRELINNNLQKSSKSTPDYFNDSSNSNSSLLGYGGPEYLFLP